MKAKTDYTELDAAILEAIRKSAWHPGYVPSVIEIAGQIAKATSRESFRVVDGRLQALRKRGVITVDRSMQPARWVEVKK
ncbi:hypothetical protein [Niveibacterium terrae]|uniref:LexA family protein n=1 Tax=Niveibacterium terrae TaxID=3373598 RepID=UPI003A8EB529